MRYIATLLLALICTSVFGDDLERAHQIYKDELNGLGAKQANSIAGLHRAYLLDLAKSIEASRKRGDLKAYVKYTDMETAFSKNPVFQGDKAALYEKQKSQLELAHAIVVVSLTDKYIAHLEKLISTLTVASSIEAALEAQKALEQVKKADIYISSVKLVDAQVKIAQAQAKASAPVKVLRPKDAERLGLHWYKVYTERVSWNDAKKRCETLGGHLVTITDAKENAAVAKLIGGLKPFGGYYIGLQKLESWEWVTGERSSFLNWNPGEPNGTSTNSVGVMYCVTGTWNDIGSPSQVISKYYGFICEWDK